MTSLPEASDGCCGREQQRLLCVYRKCVRAGTCCSQFGRRTGYNRHAERFWFAKEHLGELRLSLSGFVNLGKVNQSSMPKHTFTIYDMPHMLNIINVICKKIILLFFNPKKTQLFKRKLKLIFL